MIDIHSHILPNIDDGSRSIEETIELLNEAEQEGFTDIFLTSHYIENSYNSKKDEREKLLENIKNIIQQEGIDINLHIGSEIYIFPEIISKIKDETICTLGNTSYVLVELPMYTKINYLDDAIFSLVSKGYIPIIAHPERYEFIQKDLKQAEKLKDMGVLFQANYGSIIGIYGKDAKKTVKKLLKNNLISFLGSDVHRKNTMYPRMKKILKKLEKKIGKEKLYELTTKNAKKVIYNQK